MICDSRRDVAQQALSFSLNPRSKSFNSADHPAARQL
jgi:hypothetical protein